MADIGHVSLDEAGVDAASKVASPSPEGFAQFLIEAKKLSTSSLERATSLSVEENRRLSLVLLSLGLIEDKELAAAYAEYMQIAVLTAKEFPFSRIFSGVLNPQFLRTHRVIPVADFPDRVRLVMLDPLDRDVVVALQFALQKPVECCVAAASDIETALERLYSDTVLASDGPHAFGDDGMGDDDIDRLRDGASEAPVIRYVYQLIARAVEARASDIHFEPTDDGLRIRYRIDGVLRDIERPAPQLRSAIISRIKIMGKLDIAERRTSQDGRMSLAVRGRDIDFRISTTPTLHGEGVVLRILDRAGLTLEFGPLGFSGSSLAGWVSALTCPHGIVLVTGPTGSGKTTTLYASLLAIADPARKILTIEDPIEYQLPLINQTQVKPSIGLTFSSALRSFLRQDPDVMMIGEIRDLETARIAVQAALTGHLILSTLHTNDAASALTRLLDMGVEDYLMTSTINAVAAQRLVRLLCEHCKQKDVILPELADRLKLDSREMFRAIGCPVCGGTGYKGRTAVIEVMPMSQDIRRAVLKRSEAADIQAIAVAEGMRTLSRHGIELAATGLTSLAEIFRVSGHE